MVFSKQKNSSFVSPLPDFLRLDKNNQVTLLDLWSPFLGQTPSYPDRIGVQSEQAFAYGYNLSNLTAKSVLVYDFTADKVIFEKNVKDRMPMASLTKIMTAIISLENKRKDDRYEVKNDDLVGEDSMGLSAGEVLTQQDLLYGLLLSSGNDAAEVLASDYQSGARDGFIKAMNDKAKALGLTDTHFYNPTGLQGDGKQYTTAYDLLVITRYALENFFLFDRIVSTADYEIAESPSHKAYSLYNETNLLTTYPGVKGVKTGYTPEAGLCLVTYLEYGGHKIIGVILNSENRRGEMKELLDHSLESSGIKPPPYSG